MDVGSPATVWVALESNGLRARTSVLLALEGFHEAHLAMDELPLLPRGTGPIVIDAGVGPVLLSGLRAHRPGDLGPWIPLRAPPSIDAYLPARLPGRSIWHLPGDESHFRRGLRWAWVEWARRRLRERVRGLRGVAPILRVGLRAVLSQQLSQGRLDPGIGRRTLAFFAQQAGASAGYVSRAARESGIDLRAFSERWLLLQAVVLWRDVQDWDAVRRTLGYAALPGLTGFVKRVTGVGSGNSGTHRNSA